MGKCISAVTMVAPEASQAALSIFLTEPYLTAHQTTAQCTVHSLGSNSCRIRHAMLHHAGSHKVDCSQPHNWPGDQQGHQLGGRAAGCSTCAWSPPTSGPCGTQVANGRLRLRLLSVLVSVSCCQIHLQSFCKKKKKKNIVCAGHPPPPTHTHTDKTLGDAFNY
jgi:hypothetical protein